MRALLPTAALVVALAGCANDGDASDEGRVNDNPPVGSNAPADDESMAAESPTTESSEAVVEYPTFGETFSYDEGVSITVSPPEPFESSYKPPKGQSQIQFEVKVVNQTDATYEISGDSVTMQSGNQEAEEIFDSGKGMNGFPMTPLLPGREAVFKIAFNVSDPTDLVMSYQPNNYDLDAVFFTTQ